MGCCRQNGNWWLYGTTNDIGIVYPPHCKPIVLAIYFTQKEKNAPVNETIIASVTKIVMNEFGKKTHAS